MEEQRFGKIFISNKDLKYHLEIIIKDVLSKILIVRAEELHYKNGIEYTGYSSLFNLPGIFTERYILNEDLDIIENNIVHFTCRYCGKLINCDKEFSFTADYGIDSYTNTDDYDVCSWKCFLLKLPELYDELKSYKDHHLKICRFKPEIIEEIIKLSSNG